MTYLALPRPPGFKPRHARKSNPIRTYATAGVAAVGVVLAVGVYRSGTGTAAAAQTRTAVPVTGQVSGLTCAKATSFGHPAGTAWKLTFMISNPDAEKATYDVHWSLLDSHGAGIATGVATVAGVQARSVTTHSGVYHLDSGETSASSQAVLGEKMTCKLGQVQRLAG
ncbi:hypothetical protein [Actinoplanes sp. NPDC026619]|uniref:hypothetical protein n=1 Tax=Actinoplanes sp. NPDC026619 TaxID=3155798 RepID=UPI0033D74EF7